MSALALMLIQLKRLGADYLYDICYMFDYNGHDVKEMYGGVDSGIALVLYKNGRIKHRSVYIKGKCEGLFLSWHKNGKQSHEIEMQNGYMHGFYRSWHPNGNLCITATHKWDHFNGEKCTFHENGLLKSRGFYKNDCLDGVFESFFENGDVEYVISYKDGKRHGEYGFYYNLITDGHHGLKEYGQYENGKPIMFRTWNVFGELTDKHVSN